MKTKDKYITIVYNTANYVYKFRMNLIRSLQEQGYTIVAITPYYEYVSILEDNGIIHHPIPMSQYGMNPLQDITTSIHIYKAFLKYEPIASLHYTIKPNIFGNIAARLAKVPVINNIAGVGKAFSSNNKIFVWLIENLFRFSLSSSNKVLFQNDDDMGNFLNKKITKREISERIPGSGVDLSTFKHFQKETSSTISFLFVGRLLNQKGINEFLLASNKILNSFSDTKIVIVGEHEKENQDYIKYDQLEELTKNENIHYLGAVNPDKMPSIINESDCVVLPSYYREGVPRSLLEAAAMSKPIITTENVGCKEVVDEGINGYKCEIKNVECLIQSMTKLIQMNKDKRYEMGVNSRIKVENEFDEKIVLDKYLAIISEINTKNQ